MQKDSGFPKLHNAVVSLERRAVEDWRRQHHPSLTLEDALSQWVTILETTITSRPAGNSSVTVSVVGRRFPDSEVYYFSLQRRKNRWYEIVDIPSTDGLDQLTLSDG